MLHIPDMRSFQLECAFECSRHWPGACDAFIEQMTDRLVMSMVDDPNRTMTRFETKTRCIQFVKSLKELER